MVMYILTSIPFFKAYDRSSIERICTCFKVEYYKPDDIILNVGEIASELYIVITGEVGVYLGTDSDVCVGHYINNQIFGEKALISEKQKRTATIKAHKDTTCLVLSRDDFIDKFFHFEQAHKQK